MANTDKEKGFTRIPNELYDALLCQKLSRAQLCAVLYIIRKTYGFQKTEDSISIKKMASDTGYSRQSMLNVINDLEKMGIIKIGFKVAGRPANMYVTDPKNWDQNL